MPTFKLGKIVRHKIPDAMRALGQEVVSRNPNPEERRRAVIMKIIEEATELLDAKPEDKPIEYTDLQQSIDDAMSLDGVSLGTVRQLQVDRAESKGTFLTGPIIETVTTEEDDPWTAYYRQEPDRFPETSD